MKLFKKAQIILGGLSALVVAAVPIISTSAVSFDELPEFGMAVSPGNIEVSLEPGSTYDGSFRVSNTGRKDYTFDLTVEPFFSVDGVATYNTRNEFNEIYKYITFDQTQYFLPAPVPGSEVDGWVEVNYYINVPSNIPSGGQYAAIKVSSLGPNAAGGNISATKEISIIMYGKVGGDNHPCGKIISTKLSPFLLFSPPVKAESVIQNCGRIHFPVEQNVVFKDIFGNVAHEAKRTVDTNSANLVLPNDQRTISLNWEEAPALGLFKVFYEVNLFGETRTEEKWVLIIPIYLIIIIVVGIALLVTWLVLKRKGRKQ